MAGSWILVNLVIAVIPWAAPGAGHAIVAWQAHLAGYAAASLAQLHGLALRWRDSVETLTEQQLDTVGFGQYPWGLDPQLPIIAIVWWLNREYIHHMAEVALLRDLYTR